MQFGVVPDLNHTRNHWYRRPGWASGRRMYTFHLTMEGAAEVHRAGSLVRPVLDRFPQIDPVPTQWLHLTMRGIGFTDEVSADQLTDVADEVFDGWSDHDKGELTFDSALLAHESVMLAAHQQAWLTDLDQLQRAAIDRVLGERDWADLWPHLSLGYANATMPIGPLIESLTPAFQALPATIDATPTLTLMRLRRRERLYCWEVLRQLRAPGFGRANP